MRNDDAEQLLFLHLNQVVTLDPEFITPDNPLGVIEEAAIAIEDDAIVWVGSMDDIPDEFDDAREIDQSGLVAFPGFIDSHTHVVFAGNRATEFEARLSGQTYQQIAQAGGGILKTVNETRTAPFDDLEFLAHERVLEAMRFGVTTLEAKSGYGLTTASELKCLEVIQLLNEELPVDILPTFMGGHAIPPEFKANPDEYVDLICEEMIPAVAEKKLALYCDVFCEAGYFSVAQSRRILERAMLYGMAPKIHAEEFSDLGGALLAAELGAVSADHLLHISDAGIAALASSGTVATLLPGTAFFLQLPYAPARKLIDAGVTVALATDFNPGSCMSQNIQLMMTLGCLQMGMKPHEVIQAVTINAAKALGKTFDRGSLTPGKRADIGLFKLETWHELMYHYGVNHLEQLWIQGQPVLVSETELQIDDVSLN